MGGNAAGWQVVLFACSMGAFVWSSAAPAQPCPGDLNGDGRVTVDEILVSVNHALNGCPQPAARFVDHGDGTISDSKSGLMWEKKSDDGDIHDKDNAYTWESATAVFVAGLNSAKFAGYGDWRLASVQELVTILNYAETDYPAVPPIFKTNCGEHSGGHSGCTVTTCSCTASGYYWSSDPSLIRPTETEAWFVNLGNGSIDVFDQTGLNYVRAVRAGG